MKLHDIPPFVALCRCDDCQQWRAENALPGMTPIVGGITGPWIRAYLPPQAAPPVGITLTLNQHSGFHGSIYCHRLGGVVLGWRPRRYWRWQWARRFSFEIRLPSHQRIT